MSAPDDSSTAIRPSDETAARPPEPRSDPTVRFTPGTLLAGRYRIVSPLGKGGMGEVYRADDTRLGQSVALKFLPAALAADSSRLERLVDEVRIGRQISHPNVCRLYDIAETEGHHFMVMEYVDGEDLASLLRRIGRLPGPKALELARGLCAGLAAAHDKGIIHRDLKPANVMIDGRGHARIADFGLAALANGVIASDMSGTPHYMAPEQLTGGGATLRSDVYALGLVLHEAVTGKRVFEAKSLSDLRALHAESKPLSLSASSADVDPLLDRVIMRCLSRDPSDRPASARVVLSSLPGGDGLEAAVLAGETPSPEMVAAAAVVGDLRPLLAWSGFLAGLLGLLAIALIGGRTALDLQVLPPRAPETLADRGRDVLNRLGYSEPALDRVYRYFPDAAFLAYVQGLPGPAQAAAMRTTRPGPVLFFYRESPRPLVSTSWVPSVPWEGPAELGGLWWNDPPLTVPGMTMLFLDPMGRLTNFVAVPAVYDKDQGPWPPPDWSPAINEAGFDSAHLQPSASYWTAPVESDHRAAWEGTLPGQPDVTFHIEAAAYRGRLVHFRARGPWVKAPSAPVAGSAARWFETGLLAFALGLGSLAVLWARRNLRLGRADLKGTRRFASFTFASLALAQLSFSDHTTLWKNEFTLIALIAGQSLVGAFFAGAEYLAVEPFVRRRWPHALISWSRLVTGRFKDPLVGRDLLAGVLGGMALVLVLRLDLPSLMLGQAPALNPHQPTRTGWETAHLFFMSAAMCSLLSAGNLFSLGLFQAVVRSPWIARFLLFLVFVMVGMAGGAHDPLIEGVRVVILSGIAISVLVRFGMLSFATLLFTYILLDNVTLTLHWSAWYAGPSFAVLGFFTAVLLASAYLSVGDKPLFGKAILDD